MKHFAIIAPACLALILLQLPMTCAESAPAIFNVKDYGATGRNGQNATVAIQRAIDACAQAGGGKVYLPPGQYVSGTLHLRSHVRFYIDAGATLFASKAEADFPKPALFYGEDLQNVSIEGQGEIDGQAEYIWKRNDLNDFYIRDNMLAAQANGVPLMRSFPEGYPTRKVYPHLIQMIRCKDLEITGLRFLHSPSWSIHLWGCERVTIDGVYVHTDQKYGVWADGIDPDGCKDLIIANSTVVTGDDAIVFYSTDSFGPARACENVTITNCRLSSASSAIKFCDGNQNSIRKVTISNCVIDGSNRGIAFMVYDGGYVADVVVANLVINCKRYAWYWWGNGDPIYFTIRRRGEIEGKPPQPGERPAGSIRNITLRNIIAHGQGSCLIFGHPNSWLKNVSLENVKFFLSTDPAAAYDGSINAMRFRYADNLKLKDVEVFWNQPRSAHWGSALYFQDITRLQLDGFGGGPAISGIDMPAVVMDNVQGATVSNAVPLPGTNVFLSVKGSRSKEIYLVGNELHGVRVPYHTEGVVGSTAVKALNNY